MNRLIFAMTVAAASMLAAEYKGSISDSSCGAKHGPGKENAGCVKGCIGKGGSPVLVKADGTVLKIHNPDAVKADFYGKAVTVNGSAAGDGAIHVDSIE